MSVSKSQKLWRNVLPEKIPLVMYLSHDEVWLASLVLQYGELEEKLMENGLIDVTHLNGV
jgi:hypothetical protein